MVLYLKNQIGVLKFLRVTLSLSLLFIVVSCSGNSPSALTKLQSAGIYGKETNKSDKSPISGLLIMNETNNKTVTTDANCKFSFSDINSGTYFCKASKINYYSVWSSVVVTSGTDSEINFEILYSVSGNSLPNMPTQFIPLESM